MQVLKAGLLYFAIVFGAGFLLGPVRILWLVPRLGTRIAELLELPVMLAVTVVTARWIIRRLSVASGLRVRLAMGSIGLALLLAAEFTIVPGVSGLSIGEYLSTRDPVSGVAYYLALGVFAVMPVFVQR